MSSLAPLALLLLLFLSHSQLSLCPANTNTNCLPCASECSTCSSQNTCSGCQIEYFQSGSSCLPCPQNCLQCSSSTVCTTCSSPYVLSNNICNLCTVLNAQSCSSTSIATACKGGYYLTSGSCNSCLLNCGSCSSASDCSSCNSGYYLNSSILTCNPCPSGCNTCNQFTPSTCLTCNNGYQLSGSSCVQVTCSILNCLYCSSPTVCQQCNQFYYWSGSACVQGGSITCQNGANGPLPNNCANTCSSFGFVSGNISNTFKCKKYSSVYIYPESYHQLYYYSYNHLNELNSLTSTSQTLSTVAGGEYSYPFASLLQFSTLPNYYRITLAVKYIANSQVDLTLAASTPSSSQSEVLTLPASTSANSLALTTSVVHSYNLNMTPSAPVSLIELSLRLFRCASGCTICLNQQLCERCDAPNYMLNYNCVSSCSAFVHFSVNMTCLTSCPTNYFQTTNNTLKYCTSCSSPCQDCSNATFCLSCVSGFYYFNFTCSTSCTSGYYADNTTNTCKNCISPCRTCTSETSCLSCSLGFWDGSQCASSCASGQFADTANNVCSNCDAACLTCINSATTCTSCNSSLIFYNSQCLSSCPARFYTNNGSCSQCLPPCYTCTDASTCLTCSFNYFLNGSCQSSCPSAYYKDDSTLTCMACQSQCQTCTSSYSCSSCLSGCLFSGQCPSSCPSTSFFPLTNPSTSTCTCQQCIYPCSTCSNSSTCLSCVDGFLTNGTCSATCPTNYFGNSTSGLCQLCSNSFTNCLTCTSTGCTLCNTANYLFNGSCLTSCPTFYYISSQQCALCAAPCLTCSDPSSCLSCVTPYVLSGTNCVLQCSTGQLAMVVSNISQCVACTSPCLSCQTSPTNCTYCVYGFYLYNNQCLSNCSTIVPSNTFFSQDSTLSCKTCSFPCSTCLSETQCLSCSVGYLNPSAFTCTTCSLGTYALNSTCVNCPVSCSICYSDTYCSGCNNGYYLYVSTCISNASICTANGYYISGNVCYSCLQPCLTCSNTATNCTTCLSGYIFFAPNSCLIECPAGLYRTNNSCVNCSVECATCVTSANFCLTCSTGYYLLISNSSCVQTCPAGTFLTGTSCSLCQYPCNTCNSETVCLSCITGVLIGTQCFSSCLTGFFASNNLCLPCTSPCKECSVIATNCTQCITNYWLKSGTCLSACPATFFPQSQSQQCLQCVGLCQSCSSYINCTTCSSSFIYFFSTTNSVGQCISSCPATYYLSNGTCLNCLSTCLTCSDGTSCLTCSSSLVQLSGQCISSCPAGMYSLSGVCNNCSFPCSNCTDAYTCTSCPSGYLFVGGSSCMPGPNCPSGYYLLVNSSQCDSRCPTGFYNLLNGTCNSVSCGTQHFMGADMSCYSTCPSGYIANRTYHCVLCPNCQGLTFALTSQIIKDSLYLYLQYTQTPEYVFTPPQLQMNPPLPYQALNFPVALVGNTNNTGFSGSTNITFRINVKYSLTATYLNVTFQNQLATFLNPLQKADANIFIEGYDYYPQTLPSLSNLGIFTLIVALIGLAKNPYMLDFAQTLFLVGLVNYHFPFNLASFLESTSIAHLYGFISISQPDSLGEGKFMYLTGVGFLSNTLTNLLLIAAIVGISLIFYLILIIQRKRMNYSRVQDQTSQEQHSNDGANQEPPCLLQTLTNFFEIYKLQIFNRLIYFNYSIISLFTLVQLANFNTSAMINTISSVLALFSLIALIYYPISLRHDKPKYTFLYIRKLLISGAVVLSVQDAIYAVGVISVCNLTAAILIMTYKMEKYRVQSKFLAGCQIVQLLIMGMVSFFIMIGEGNSTSSKVTLCYAIVIFMALLLLTYVVESSIQLVCFVCYKARDADLRQQWKLNNQEDEQSSHHSESINGSMKDAKSDKSNKSKAEDPVANQNGLEKDAHLDHLLSKLKEEMMKDKVGEGGSEQNGPEDNTKMILSRSPDKKGVFWAYQQSQKDQNEQQPQMQPPKILVRCINQFSDVDQKQPGQE